MKTFYIFFILFLSIALSFGQGGWKKRYYLPNGFTSLSQNIFETPSGQYITIGITSDTLNNKVFNRLTLVGSDSVGNYLWRKDYGGPNFIYALNSWAYHAGVLKDTTCFYFTGVIQDTALRAKSVLIKFNFNGDTLWQKVYRDSLEDVILQNLTKSVDGGFLITGSFQNWNDHTYPTLMMKTDLNGHELWRKRIHKVYQDVSGGNAIVQDSATKKIIISGFQEITTSNAMDVYSNILILDSLGNKILQTTFNNAGGQGFYDLIQLKDKNFLTSGAYTKSWGNGDSYVQAYVVKFNLNGSIIWDKKFYIASPTSGFAHAKELDNGSLVVLGSVDTSLTQNSIYHQRTILTKLDKNGNFISSKYIGYPFESEIDEFPLSLDKTKDNGFVIATWFPNMNNPRPFSIIKVDSTFCDTTTQWCLSVELGLSNFNKLSGYNFNMYPNPANEQVNFKLEMPLEKSIEISISDVAGREIENLKLGANDNLQLNTREYKAGVYFVNLIYEGQKVDTKKLVIVR